MGRFKWRDQYDDERDAEEREATDVWDNRQREIDAIETQQQFREDVDLNTIVARMGVTDGAIPHPVLDPRFYGDFSDVVDFRDALDATRNALNNFAQLPAELRRRFHDDPTELYAFVIDPANDAEAVKLGLLKQMPPPTPASEQTPPNK